jgi:hypothetical protein
LVYDAPAIISKGVFQTMSYLYALLPLALQSDDNNPMQAVLRVFFLTVVFAIVVTTIAGAWKTFTKAGEPGWGYLIPIYNLYLMTKIAGRPGWWTILMLVPLINIVFQAIVQIGIAQNFGKSGAFGLGLLFLPFIFYPILGFGDAVYRGGRRP